MTRSRRTLTIATLLCTWTALPVVAKETQSKRTDVLSPQDQLKSFHLPEGFVIELVASEAEGIVNPIDLAFDDHGRLWTQTARMYPLDPAADIGWNDLLKLMNDPEAQQRNPEFKRILDLYQGKTRGDDQILILSHLDAGQKPQVSVFADGLAIPQSILPYKSGAFVAQGSELFHLADTDGDGKADQREPVLTGFGFTDTHTMAHTLVRGPGDWIYFSHGALNQGEVTAVKSGRKTRVDYSKIGRFSLDGTKVEVVSSGLNNIWGFWMRPNGQWWGTEANDFGMSIVPMEPGTGYQGIGNQRIRPYQPWMPPLHKFRVGGTGISGLAFADDESGSFPADWKDVALLANPITCTINTVRIKRNEDGTVTAEHLPDFLTCDDDWFRPVNIEFGPDGCLYIADWYNKIISHNEVPRTHPDRDKKHGRIWRIRHTGSTTRKIPDLTLQREGLVEHLAAPSAWEKRAAMQQIIDNGLDKLADPVKHLAANPSAHPQARIHALWTLEGLKHYDAKLMGQLLTAKESDLRREAVRSMGILAPDSASFQQAMAKAIDDPNPMVRSEALRTVADRGEADAALIDILVSACKPERPGNHLGGPYERKFERYLARKALEPFPDALRDYFASPASAKQPNSHLVWACQALPEADRNRLFPVIWKLRDPVIPLDESTFVILAKMLPVAGIPELAGPALQHPDHAPTYVRYTLANQAEVQSAPLIQIMTAVLEAMLGKPDQRMTALDAIGRLRVPVKPQAITAFLDDKTPHNVVNAALKALQANPAANTEVIASLAKMESIPVPSRLSAAHSLLQIAPPQGDALLGTMLESLNADAIRVLASELSSSKPGAQWLLKRHADGQLVLRAFDVSSAEKVAQFEKQNPAAKQLLDTIRGEEAKRKQEVGKKLEHLMKVPDQLRGDPAQGKALFQTCLLCHKVGDQGFAIAPALDGSAHRDREALLTAILDPDAAIESSYQLYRVRKKDDTTVEGYLSQRDDKGTTVAFMGGTTVFVPSAEIATQGFVSGRSFMPTSLISGHTDQQVADLLAYIQTLK